jgi:hypothetical protein
VTILDTDQNQSRPVFHVEHCHPSTLKAWTKASFLTESTLPPDVIVVAGGQPVEGVLAAYAGPEGSVSYLKGASPTIHWFEGPVAFYRVQRGGG